MNDAFGFYNEVPVFHEFHDVMNPKNYREVPSDWVVVISDIRSSTKHIENGRYKDINMVGASTIIAVINSLPGKNFFYCFGGDGATMIVPAIALPQIRPALFAAQKMAKDEFDFDLRVGVVPIAELKSANHVTLVSRHQISPTSQLTMLRGGGAAVADKWIKENPKYLLSTRNESDPPPAEDLFAGLQCRWKPLQTRNGAVLSILVRSLKEESVYIEVLEAIQNFVGGAQANPASPRQMRMHWPILPCFTNETKIRTWQRGVTKRIQHFFFLFSFIPFLKMARALNLSFGRNFRMKKYVDELVANTDYRKFDDILRLVIDVSIDQARAIRNHLEKRKEAGDLVFGCHLSNSALMTCLVFTPDHHVHFVDGAHGGYTLAAKQLKP